MTEQRIVFVICKGSTVRDRAFAGVYGTIMQADAVISQWPGWHIEWATAEDWLLELHGLMDYWRAIYREGDDHYGYRPHRV